MNRDEIDGNAYKDKRDERLDYVTLDVLGTAFRYARFCNAMEEVTGFSMKDFFSAPGLGWKYLKSLRTEGYQHICTYKVKYMRFSVGQFVKGGRVCSFNQ